MDAVGMHTIDGKGRKSHALAMWPHTGRVSGNRGRRVFGTTLVAAMGSSVAPLGKAAASALVMTSVSVAASEGSFAVETWGSSAVETVATLG